MGGLSSTLGLVGDRPVEEIIRRLTLDITRRLDGMLHGDYMGIVPGRGSEPGEARAYMAGDDVRHIDWNVTARMQDPYLRETIADRELKTWILIDRSPGMDFGTAECEKRDGSGRSRRGWPDDRPWWQQGRSGHVARSRSHDDETPTGPQEPSGNPRPDHPLTQGRRSRGF